jgi:hypothetical protein
MVGVPGKPNSGVYCTEQLVVAPTPLRVQLVPGELKEPLPLLAKETLPLGEVAPDADVSVTLAVQVVVTVTATGFGVQLTEVVVVWVEITVRVTAVPEPAPTPLIEGFALMLAV